MTTVRRRIEELRALLEAEKSLKKIPPNTEISNMMSWSSWDGKLALITGPMHSSSGYADETWFNSAQQSRLYSVRFAVDGRGKRLDVPDKRMLGNEVRVKNPSQPYYETSWSWQRDTFSPLYQGSFEKKTEDFLIGVATKDLSPAEVNSMEKQYKEWGYVDVSGERAKLADVRNVMAKKKFVDTQDMDTDLANLAYRMVYIKNGFRDPKDERDEQIVWESIQGAFSRKGSRILFAYPGAV